MNVQRLVKILAVLSAVALLPFVVRKALLHLTGTVVRDERRWT